jgi:hypothetical protein
MTLRRNQPHNVRQAASQAAQLANQRKTCELCSHLRALRPMCMAEASPHWRRPRDKYHDACTVYAPKGFQNAKPVRPEPEPVSRAEIAGEVVKRKHNRWAQA